MRSSSLKKFQVYESPHCNKSHRKNVVLSKLYKINTVSFGVFIRILEIKHNNEYIEKQKDYKNRNERYLRKSNRSNFRIFFFSGATSTAAAQPKLTISFALALCNITNSSANA